MPVPLNQFAAHVIALMALRTQNTLLEIRRIRTVQQHVLIMIRFNHQMVRRTDIRFHLGVHTPAVRHQHNALTLKIETVSQAVRRVMFDTEGVNLHPEQLPFLSFLEIPPARAQFLPNSVVAVDTFVNLRRRVDR